jgi:hypothetical protein
MSDEIKRDARLQDLIEEFVRARRPKMLPNI